MNEQPGWMVGGRAPERRSVALVALCCLALAALLTPAHAQLRVRAIGEVIMYPSEASESTPADNATHTDSTGTLFNPQLDYLIKVKYATGASINSSTNLWYLAWPGLIDADQVLLTGQMVNVTGVLVGTSLYVSTLKVLSQAPPQNFFYGTANVTVTSITFLVSLCGQASVSSVSAFKSIWTTAGARAANTNVNNTVEALYRDCSWGKVQFPDASNVVVDLRNQTPPASIRDAIPCAGSSMTCNGVLTTLDGGQCAPLRASWMQWAMDTAWTVYKINATLYSRRVMIIPPLSVFMVSGLASIGIGVDGATNAFIQGPYALASPRSPFHELGHNYGLRHSWSLRSGVLRDYDDVSCGMGSVAINGTKPRCLNAPQAWYSGWAEAVDTLNETTLPAGRWVTRTIPAYMTTKTNLLRVTSTWVSLNGPHYFFSWRTPVGRDTVLEPWYYSGISVHEYNATRTAQSSAYPVLQASFITPGSTLRLPLAKLAAKFVSNTTASATLSLCRYTQTTETSCTDGLDNDCNGLTDAQDPACKTG